MIAYISRRDMELKGIEYERKIQTILWGQLTHIS